MRKPWKSCGFAYETKCADLYHGRITQEEFEAWYNANCYGCPCSGEICYYGEELPNGEFYDDAYISRQVQDTIDPDDWSKW